MTPQEQAQKLLDKASRVMSQREKDVCQSVVDGVAPTITEQPMESVHGIVKSYRCNEWERIATEFAAYLK